MSRSLIHNKEAKLGILQQSITSYHEQEEVPCTNVRDILKKYRAGDDTNGGTNAAKSSWLDEIDEEETQMMAQSNIKSAMFAASLKDTSDQDFSDIEMIRRKYMGVFQHEESIKRGSSPFRASASGSRKKADKVEASIDNLLNTIKSSKKT